MEAEIESEGFDDLEKLLQDFAKKVEDPMQLIEPVAKTYCQDVRKLPHPRSKSSAGCTHLLDTVTYKRKTDEIEVGWGKYYGPMVDRGTVKMSARSHIKPTFEKNKNKYYKQIEDNFYK